MKGRNRFNGFGLMPVGETVEDGFGYWASVLHRAKAAV